MGVGGEERQAEGSGGEGEIKSLLPLLRNCNCS